MHTGPVEAPRTAITGRTDILELKRQPGRFLGSVVALVGLAAITYLLAPIPTDVPWGEHGQVIDFAEAVTRSPAVVERGLSLRELYHAWVPPEAREWAFAVYGNGALYVVVPFLWVLEMLFPAKRRRPLLAKAFLQDLVWFLVLVPTNILVVSAVIRFLADFYSDHLGFLTIHATTAWPAWAQVLTALLAGEFLHWFTHFLRHKIQALWVFHAVHHSQKELNVFTDDRQHLIDRLVPEFMTFLPLLILQVPSLYAVAVVVFYRTIHSRFLHANLRIDFGWLSWLLVSPQFHRVHHSIEPEHADKNFGAVLSIFDHLFGTACSEPEVYPETGVADPDFPNEGRFSVWQAPVNWARQTVYPFGQLARRFGR